MPCSRRIGDATTLTPVRLCCVRLTGWLEPRGQEECSVNDDDFAELFKRLSSGQSAGTSWQEVAAEFEALTRTLGDVVRGAWQRQNADSGIGRLRDMLASAIQELNDAVDGTPEAQQAREQFGRVAESLRAAADRAGDELRPELLRMLRQANAELRRRSGLDEDASG